MLALMVGVITIVAGIGKLGFIADLISKPTMIGYMNGLALTILVGQLPKLFGFKVDADGFIGELTGFFKDLAHGDAVPAAAATGIAGIVLILALQRWLPKIPAVLIINHLIDRPIVLGVEHADLALLILTLAVSMITFTSGRTNMLQGVVHLLLFAAYILLNFQG